MKNDLLDSAVTREGMGPAALSFSLSAAEHPRRSLLEMLHTHGNSESYCFSYAYGIYTQTSHSL